MAVLAQPLLATLRNRLTGYVHPTPDAIRRRFPRTSGLTITTGESVTVRLGRRAYSLVLRQTDLIAATPVPW